MWSDLMVQSGHRVLSLWLLSAALMVNGAAFAQVSFTDINPKKGRAGLRIIRRPLPPQYGSPWALCSCYAL